MGPLERVRKLEEVRLRQSRHTPDTEEDLEQRRAALREILRRGWERAEAEAAAGDTRRLRALEELERSMKERVRARQGNPDGA